MWKIRQIMFDTKLPVIPQYEHIFGDEGKLLPVFKRVRDSSMKMQLFDGALKQTKRMLEADYRTAIPQYYNHSINLLLPICLRHPGKPDLALACMKRTEVNISGAYLPDSQEWPIILPDSLQGWTEAG